MSGEVKVRKSDWPADAGGGASGVPFGRRPHVSFFAPGGADRACPGDRGGAGGLCALPAVLPHAEGPVSRRRRADASLARDAGYPVLGREEIPRGAIKAVHCWPNRDALGHAGRAGPSILRPRGKPPAPLPDRGGGAGPVRPAAPALVVALGYGGQWAGSPDVPS